MPVIPTVGRGAKVSDINKSYLPDTEEYDEDGLEANNMTPSDSVVRVGRGTVPDIRWSDIPVGCWWFGCDEKRAVGNYCEPHQKEFDQWAKTLQRSSTVSP